MTKVACVTDRSTMAFSPFNTDCDTQLVASYSDRCDNATGFSGWLMRGEHRSGCPVNLTLEVVGDKWSLLIIRDMIFGNRRHFRELLTRSEEGIASNIPAAGRKRLVKRAIVTKADDPSHKQK